MNTPVQFSSVIYNAAERCRVDTEERLSLKRIHEYGCTQSVKRKSTGTGASQLAYLFKLLDSFGMKRSNVQIQLHKGMAGEPCSICCLIMYTGSVLQRIFSSDSDAEMKLAMQRHNIDSCKQQFMAITPRRFG
jgi:hypothetical protein